MLIVLLLCAIATAATTWVVGWWGVVLAALLVGAVQYRRRGVEWLAALGAVVAWSALLLLDVASGRFGALATVLGGVMRLPAGAIVAVTLLFAALLAWSSAVVGSELGRTTRSAAAPE
jgi:hypothetical protein